jgi:hypothetical protein
MTAPSDQNRAPKPAPRAPNVPHAPNGTRDVYPEDALRRRYITQAWRASSR